LVPHRTRVLVVDDNQDLVDTLMVLLDADGYNAKGIYSARTILVDVEEFDPDVIILDLGMPGKSGGDAARDILRCRRGTQQPMLIAISGEFTKGLDGLRVDLSDFDYYLVKPCDPAVLSTLVASYPNTRPNPESQVVRA